MWQVKLALSAACLCAAVSHVQAVGKNVARQRPPGVKNVSCRKLGVQFERQL